MSARFACRACGQCCRHVGAALAAAAAMPVGSVLQQAGATFPHDVAPDGSCAKLQADNTCGVYATRPLFCDVDRVFEALAVPGLTRETWHALNAAGCPPEQTPHVPECTP